MLICQFLMKQKREGGRICISCVYTFDEVQEEIMFRNNSEY
jgi:hypothetical protein